MNRPKVTHCPDENKYVKMLSRIMKIENGTQAGINALSESLKRGDAYVKAQQRINEICVPERSQLSNTLVKEATNV